MIQDRHNLIPFSAALVLHVIIFGSLIVVLDFTERARPAVPLAIKGVIVTDNAVVIPPPVVEEEVPPEPDITEQQRIQAEEAKRREDARIEQERLNRIKQQEEDRKRQVALEEERKRKAEEARKEQERIAAEKRRQEEIERQRLENERLRAEVEAARQAELTAETNRIQAMQADAKTAYMFAIQQRISRNWVKPPTATAGIECVVNIRQLPGGEVVSVSIGTCNGDSAVRRSIENAVRKASPLPAPADPSVFDRNLRLIFKPTE